MITDSLDKGIVCVTGATGMVGSKITALLLSHGYTVRILTRKSYPATSDAEVFKGNIQDEDMLRNFMRGAKIVFHCAAELKDESQMEAVNVRGTELVLKIAEISGIKYFCYLSSVGVIGSTNVKTPNELTACNPQNTYEKTKWASEQIVARGIKGCKVVILRPTNVIDEERPGVLAIPKRGSFLDFCKVFVKGGECAHIVHAEDVAAAALHFISYPMGTTPECYIVSCDREPLNTLAGLWALYNAFRNKKELQDLPPPVHLPLIVPYILRKILRIKCNMGNIRYSSEKLLKTGFTFKLGLKGAIDRIASASGGAQV